MEAIAHLILGEVRCSLVSLVEVFLIDCAVVPAGVFAALDDQEHETVELGVGVVGVVDMCGRLLTRISMGHALWILLQVEYVPSCPSATSFLPGSVRRQPRTMEDYR